MCTQKKDRGLENTVPHTTAVNLEKDPLLLEEHVHRVSDWQFGWPQPKSIGMDEAPRHAKRYKLTTGPINASDGNVHADLGKTYVRPLSSWGIRVGKCWLE